MQETYIDKEAVIAPSSSVGVFSTIRKGSQIGERTQIGSHVCISENVRVGNDCIIGDMVSICGNVEIGDNTFIESGVVFVEKLNQRAKDEIDPPKTVIGNNVSIHSRAIIEAGSRLEDDTLVDYGEIIRKSQN